jgi:hypothetical protein
MLLAISAIFMPLAAAEPTYCAFEVKVSGPSGTPLAKVPVLMLRRDTTVFAETTTTKDGTARLCDAPLDPVDIVVGFDMCGSVVVRVLKPTWPKIRRVFVTYLQTFCDHLPSDNYCQVLLRVHDEKGRPVAGARFEGSPSDVSDVSDIFGRLFRLVRPGEKLEGVVTKDGRQSDRVSEQCIAYDEHDAELKVVLRNR